MIDGKPTGRNFTGSQNAIKAGPGTVLDLWFNGSTGVWRIRDSLRADQGTIIGEYGGAGTSTVLPLEVSFSTALSVEFVSGLGTINLTWT